MVEFEGLISTVAWFLGGKPECTFVTAYHDRDAEYDISGVLRRWGLRASMIERGGVLVDQRTVELVKGQRPEDDPEEWPEDLSRAPIFLILVGLG